MKQISDFFSNKTVQGVGLFIAILLLALPYLSSMTGLLSGVQWQMVLQWLRDPIWQTVLGMIAVLLALPSVFDWWRKRDASSSAEPESPPSTSTSRTSESAPDPTSDSVSESTSESASARPPTPTSNRNIPLPTYHQFIGRETLKEQVEQSLLSSPMSSMSIVALIGLGGVGKTALAREVVTGIAIAGVFATTTWLSAKKEEFKPYEGGPQPLPEHYDVTFDNLLNAIAKEIQKPEIMLMPSQKKQDAIQQVLHAERHLVVLDNLETVPAYHDLVHRLHPLLGQSRALLTSRHYEKLGTVKLIRMHGLPKDEARAFLRAEAKRLGVEAVLRARMETLDEIHEKVDAMPLAMKLLVGQLQTQALDQIVTQLRDKRVTVGAIYDLYRYLFQTSWDLLTDPERDLLVSMAGFVQPNNGTLPAIRASASLPETDFDLALPRLVSLSLIDQVGSAGNERYAIHALTDLFVQSDITEETEWREA